MDELSLRKMVEETEVRIIRANPEYQALLRVARAVKAPAPNVPHWYDKKFDTRWRAFVKEFCKWRQAQLDALKEMEHLL